MSKENKKKPKAEWETLRGKLSDTKNLTLAEYLELLEEIAGDIEMSIEAADADSGDVS